jgi:hypothetical protein
MQPASGQNAERLQLSHLNVEVTVLLPTPHVLQLKDQGVTKIYKSYYTQNVCRYAIQAIDSVTFDNVKQYRYGHSFACMCICVCNS